MGPAGVGPARPRGRERRRPRAGRRGRGRRRARCIRFRPDPRLRPGARGRRSGRAVGCGPATPRPAPSSPMDVARARRRDRRRQHGRGRARRPTGCAARPAASTVRIASTAVDWFARPCTTVVIAVGQWLRRPRPRAPRPSRRRPRRGPGLRDCAPGERRAMRRRLAHRHPPPAPPDPHARRPARVEIAAGSGALRRGRRRRGRDHGVDVVAEVRPHGLPAARLSVQSASRHPRVAPRDAPTIAIPMLYAPETFTDDEAATLRPYFTNLDGPVFALTNLPEVVKGALFARYSRSDKSLRRLFLDEFVGDLDLTGDLTVDATVGLQARRGALRARVLRVRRRLRRAARRRAPRVRAGVEPAHEGARVGPADGVPRAVDALHPVRLAAARSLPLPAAVRGLRVATRRALRRRHGRPLRHLQRDAARDAGLGARALSRRSPADSDFVYKQTIKAKACDAVRGVLPGRDALERRHLRHRPGLRSDAAAHARAPAARGAHLRAAHARRAAQGHPVVPRPGRPARPRRRVDRRTCTTRSDDTAERRRADLRRGASTRRRPTKSRSSTGIPTAKTRCWPRSVTRTRTCPRRSSSTACAASGSDDRVALMRAYVGDRTNRRHKPGRAFERTALPLRRPRRLRRVPRSATPPHADDRVAEPVTPRHGYDVPGRGRRRRRRRRASTTRMERSARAARRARRVVPATRPRTRSRSGTACVT